MCTADAMTMEPSPVADENKLHATEVPQGRSDDDHPASVKKKRGKRKKKKDVHKWIANLETALDEADVEATTNSDEAPPTAVASRTHLNEETRTVDGAPEKVSRQDKAAPKDGALETEDGAALTTEPDEAAETAVAKITKPLEGSPRTVEAAPEDVVCRCDSPLCSCAGGSVFWVRDYVQNFLGCSGSYPDMKAKYDLHQDVILSVPLQRGNAEVVLARRDFCDY